VWPYLLDDPSTFVASGQRKGSLWNRKVAREDVIVGVAEARRCHFDQEFALTGAFHIEFDHLPLSGLIEQDRCFAPHCDSLRMTASTPRTGHGSNRKPGP
jgi:hypothetical protein